MKKILLVIMVIPLVLRAAAGFNSNAQKIDIRTNSSTANYKTAEEFNGLNLGTFLPGDYLHIRAAESWINKNNGSDVTGVSLYYRVYKSIPGSFSSLGFTWQEENGSGTIYQRWGNYSTDYDVLSQVTSGGTWYIEIYRI